MPSFTDHNGDSGSELPGIQPILGTGLNVRSPKITIDNGNGNTTMTPPDGHVPRKHRASVGKKTTARPPTYNEFALDDTEPNGANDPQDTLFSQVYEWLQHEKAKQRGHKLRISGDGNGMDSALASDGDDDDEDTHAQPRTAASKNKTLALEGLEKILLEYTTSRYDGSNTSVSSTRRFGRRRQGKKGLRRASASESDNLDVEYGVPYVDASLDNSRTLGYSGGAAEDEQDGATTDSKRAKERDAWLTFKNEIVRLAHTMGIKGWRKFPKECAGDIDVVRLSGALTNAVYVVTPPANLPPPPRAEDGSYTLVPRRSPQKLLLRIYGPQVEHLIDREKELQILRRLGRKNIGPKVLGTFNNGRFEQYFEARTLTPEDLRYPDTMKSIAKRMRELHDGIELEKEEREGGPMVLKNWDKWVDRCEQVISWLDKEIQSDHNDAKAQSESWRRRGFVCGVPWPLFRRAVDHYRKWLEDTCGGADEIKRQLVFAHNDTQYGNLLRLEPKSESPLLLPANEHKQLVVIDFEYASANTPGFEFANHFSEWCYNYMDPEYSYYFDIKQYPTPEQQHNFISAYVSHRPFNGQSSVSPSGTPQMRAATSNPPTFNLDDHDPNQTQKHADAEKAAEDIHEAEVQFFMRQTRLWRVINSAQWVAWGVVQAKVPGMEEGIAAAEAEKARQQGHENGHGQNENGNGHSNGSAEQENGGDGDDDDFDYLAYAQDRAMIFWADMLAFGLVKEDELPSHVVEHVKSRTLEY